MNRKKSIVRKNFMLSMGFGILMGIVFPFYASFFVVFTSQLKMLIFTAGCVIAGILVGFSAFLITRLTILKVVKQVQGQLEDFGSGSADLTKKIVMESHDELGALVESFNKFIDSMNDLLTVSQENSESSLAISQDLSKNMYQTGQAVMHIDDSLGNINQFSEYQVEQFSVTKTAIGRLNRTIITAISNVLELFSMMDELTNQLLNQSDSIEKMYTAMDQLTELTGIDTQQIHNSFIGSSSSMIDVTNQTLVKNEDSFINLKALIGDIEQIANRTGILSINASIEAARSGSKGSGFSIIAHEVRNLSQETELLSGKITERLEESVEDIVDSKSRIRDAQSLYMELLSELKDSISHLKNEASEIKSNTHQVKNNYVHISEMLKLIKNSLQNVKTETKSSEESLDNLEESTSSIKDSMNQVRHDSEEINSLMKATESQVELIAEVVVSMTGLLGRFKAG